MILGLKRGFGKPRKIKEFSHHQRKVSSLASEQKEIRYNPVIFNCFLKLKNATLEVDFKETNFVIIINVTKDYIFVSTLRIKEEGGIEEEDETKR